MNVETGFPRPEGMSPVADVNMPEALSSAFNTLLGEEFHFSRNFLSNIPLSNVQRIANIYKLSVTAKFLHDAEEIKEYLDRGDQVIGRFFRQGKIYATHIVQIDDEPYFPRMLNRGGNNDNYPLSLVRATNDLLLMKDGYNVLIISRQEDSGSQMP